jgi:hypothetical protein
MADIEENESAKAFSLTLPLTAFLLASFVSEGSCNLTDSAGRGGRLSLLEMEQSSSSLIRSRRREVISEADELRLKGEPEVGRDGREVDTGEEESSAGGEPAGLESSLEEAGLADELSEVVIEEGDSLATRLILFLLRRIAGLLRARVGEGLDA